MPKNKGAGGKARRRGKGDFSLDNRELVFKEDGQEYALVTKMLGGTNVKVTKSDGTECVAHIRGSFRKKVYIIPGDLVLLGIRDFQQDKADVIYKYTNDEQRMLKSYGEIDDNLLKNGGSVVGGATEDGNNDITVEFSIDDI